jgi:RNA polymerase sigma-54 factor
VELKQTLNLKMQQQLVMTPQLQQAIKLLQLSRPELLETVQEELVENPVLEEGPEIPTLDTAAAPSDLAGEAAPEAAPEAADPDTATDATQMDWESFVENYNQYSYSPGASGVRYGDDDMPTIDQTLSRRETLYEHLTWQLGLTQFTDPENRLAEEIIGNVNPNGYFNGELLGELSVAAGLELDEAEAVLEVIHEFDPIGVGARNLRECLLIQAKHYFPYEDVVHCIIEEHLSNLESRTIKPILRDLKIDKDDLREAVDIISSLEPKPGRGFESEETRYITPDVYIVKVGEDYVVQLNEDGMPRLRISRFYESQIQDKKTVGETKDFIQQKFRSAVWLIRSIHQRQTTIRRVTESIVRFQREFLDSGVAHLRPLILREVADDIGMHESTISRVTTNKYVHTPQGIFELKYFFNSRISSTDGPDLASESVKQRIKQIVGEEDGKKPFSDQKICALLAEEGTEIARRTVAKYREMLGILPSSKRRQIF